MRVLTSLKVFEIKMGSTWDLVHMQNSTQISGFISCISRLYVGGIYFGPEGLFYIQNLLVKLKF